MAEDYDPELKNQHAQLLFDNWSEGDLPDLYQWLSERNIDANVTPHAHITQLYVADTNPEVEDGE